MAWCLVVRAMYGMVSSSGSYSTYGMVSSSRSYVWNDV